MLLGYNMTLTEHPKVVDCETTDIKTALKWEDR
jgi:hypothetical protein